MTAPDPQSTPQLGPALVSEGVITADQLREALTARARNPRFTLGQWLHLHAGVPQEVVDEVNMRRVVLPLAEAALVDRLAAIAAQDRYARGLDVAAFVRRIESRPLNYDTKSVESRHYECSEQACPRSSISRYVLTEAEVRVVLHTVGGSVSNDLKVVKPDSEELFIVGSDEQLSTTLYYDLKACYLKTLA